MFVDNGGIKLHVQTDGAGEPTTVYAHGLTNTCAELAMFTPLMPGTSVRFCFRGHGHSDAPAAGYTFREFASDLDVVARETGATRAVGTSLGAGAICSLLADDPRRFDAMIFLLPAGIDGMPIETEGFLWTADLLESMPKDEAIAAILADGDDTEAHLQMPWMREMVAEKWADADPRALATAIREVVADRPLQDRTVLQAVEAPVLIVCREHDPIHPVAVGEALADQLPQAELQVFSSDEDFFQAIPALINRAQELLA